MTEKSILWTAPASGDGTSSYTQAETTRLFRHLVGGVGNEGVLFGVDNGLEPTGTSSPVQIDTGSAFAFGFFYWNDAALNVAVTTPSVGTTGHRIVLRVNWSAATVRITLLSSADGTATIPAMTQTESTTWDIPIASLTITTGGVITLTDDREFLHFATMISEDMLEDDAITLAKRANRSREIFVPIQDNWDSDNNNRYAWIPQGFGFKLPDAKEVSAFSGFYCPEDFVSGMTAKPVVYCAGSGSGNIYYEIDIEHGKVGENFTNHTVATGFLTQSVTKAQITELPSVSLPSVAKNDYITLEFARNAINAADTLNADVAISGWLIQYTADS